jgi:hypothetical protein
MWGTQNNTTVAVTSLGGVLRYDGSSWADTWPFGDPWDTIWSIHGTSATDLFAVGDAGKAIRSTNGGANWTEMTSGFAEYLKGVWAAANDNVLAVGKDGTVLHYDGNVGNNWADKTTLANHLEAVWGASANDVFIAGKELVVHYDGATTWTTMTGTAMGDYLFGVWGTSASDVFIVGWDGAKGIVLHYDGNPGKTLMRMTMPVVAEKFFCAWGNGSNDVFVGARNGRMLHYNGTSWSAMNMRATMCTPGRRAAS